MTKIIFRISFLLLFICSTPALLPAENITSKTKSTLPDGVISLGGRASIDDNDGFIDVLDPIWGTEDGFLFINPRASISEGSANEENVGLGARKLIWEDRAVLGANVFYDNRESTHGNRFHQLGVGVEFLTEWIDFRTNYYLPENGRDLIASQEIQEGQSSVSTSLGDTFFRGNSVLQDGLETTRTITTTHHFDQFESAMEGIDFEIGMKLPLFSKSAETRVYGGYYFYDARYGDDLNGFKARLEMRARPGLILDAEWYEDRELHGSDWYVGARIRLPFEIGNIFQRKNPFEGAKEYFQIKTSSIRARLTDMVMRDIDIITEASDFIEDPAKLKIEKELTQKSFEVTLQGGIIFVDGDRGQGNGKTVLPSKGLGVFENPYTTIQEAVNASPEGGIIYVDDAKKTYNENVKLKDGMKLWGSGLKQFGHESGVYPVVDGRSQGPAIEMANDSTVMGMEVTHTDQPGVGNFRTVAGYTFNLQKIGIYSENKTNIVLRSNVISLVEEGVILTAETLPNFSATLQSNFVSMNSFGVSIFGEGNGGTFQVKLLKNDFVGNSGFGSRIVAQDFETVDLDVIGNEFAYNGQKGWNEYVEPGFAMDIVSAGDIRVTINDNVLINDNLFSTGGADGIHAFFFAQGEIAITALRNVIGGSGGDGLHIEADSALSSINLDLEENIIGLNKGKGINVNLEAQKDIAAQILLNGVGEDGEDEIAISAVSRASDIRLLMQENFVVGTIPESDIVLLGSGNGLKIELGAERNIFADITSNLSWLNLGAGMDMSLMTARGDIAASFSNNDLSFNGDVGVALFGEALAGGAKIHFQNNVTEDNSRDGIRADLVTSGRLSALFEQNSSKRNGYEYRVTGDGELQQRIGKANGAAISATSIDGDVNLQFVDNSLVENVGLDDFGKGLKIEADAKTDVSIYGEGNIFSHNYTDGLSIFASTLGEYKIDFGGGVLGSPGKNSFFGQTGDLYDFYVENANPSEYVISAGSNWWGRVVSDGNPPDVSDGVDYGSPLTENPDDSGI